MNVRIPQVASIRDAIELYWSRTEIGTNDICTLFGGIGRERAGKLKSVAREYMREPMLHGGCASRIWSGDMPSSRRSQARREIND